MASPDDPLGVRVVDAVLTVAAAVAGDALPPAQAYRRSTLDAAPDRDGLPCLIAAPTPGRTVGRKKTLSWADVTYPVTVVLLAPKGDGLGSDPGWRVAWADAVISALDTDLELDEAINVDPDAFTELDLSTFDGAGVWRSAISVVVTCRTPLVRAN